MPVSEAAPQAHAQSAHHWKYVWKKRFITWSRWLHIYLSMVSFAILFFFAATGLTVNHPEWFTKQQRTITTKGAMPQEWLRPAAGKDVPKLEIVEQLRKANGVKSALADFRIDDSQLSVSFKGPGYTADTFIDRDSGKYELTETRMGWGAVINDLHKGRDAGSVWKLLIDICAVLMTLVSLTGIALIFFLAKRRFSGLVAAAVGAALCYALYILFGPEWDRPSYWLACRLNSPFSRSRRQATQYDGLSYGSLPIAYTTVDRRIPLEKRKYLLLLALTVLYTAGACARAAGRPFWYDEIITLVVANSPDLATTWRAAVTTDANPPLPHLLTHLSIHWFGLNEITARIPAIAGFWILCLCLFSFVQRRAGTLHGFCALLLPILTGAYYYSAEARAYGLELGFIGIALVAWQAAAEGRKRAAALFALALSLAAMLFCQYYAVVAYLPLAGAELFRARRSRRIDWGIWIAFLLGGVPLVWRAATITSVVKGFSNTWTPAYLRQGIEFWESGLTPLGPYLALLLGVLALFGWRANSASPQPASTSEDTSVPQHEWVAGALFIAIPLATVIGALLVTHMFTERYALPGLIGVCLLVPLLAARLTGRTGTIATALLAVLVWGATVRLLDSGARGNPYEAEPILQAALEKGLVVIPDGHLFLQMWHYAPPRLKPRLVFLADEAAARKYIGFDTIDGGIRALPEFGHMIVEDYAAFSRPGREFTLYQTALRPGWVLARVVEDGAKVEIQRASSYRQLISVRLRD